MTQKSLSVCLPLLSALLVISLTACAVAPSPAPTEDFHRSRDYVVYRFQTGDTAAGLADRFLKDPSKAWMIEEANEELIPGRHVVIPLKYNNPGGIRLDGVQQIPILCYHRFGDACSSPLCMPNENFERQMKYLKDNGYYVIDPKELLEFLKLRRPLPRKSVMITIDAG